MSFFTFFELQIITVSFTRCFSQDSIFWADHPYVIFKEQTTFMSYKRGNNACYLVKKNYAITLINHTKNVKLIVLSSLPFPLFEDLLLFFFWCESSLASWAIVLFSSLILSKYNLNTSLWLIHVLQNWLKTILVFLLMQAKEKKGWPLLLLHNATR